SKQKLFLVPRRTSPPTPSRRRGLTLTLKLSGGNPPLPPSFEGSGGVAFPRLLRKDLSPHPPLAGGAPCRPPRGKWGDPHRPLPLRGGGGGMSIRGRGWDVFSYLYFMSNKIIPYDRHLKMLARDLRKNMTPSERIIWAHIRRRALGVEFHRQVP